MRKIALILAGLGMISAFAGPSSQSADSSCTSPKFSPENICDTLSTLTDSSRLFIYIILPPPKPDSEYTPAYRAKLKVWSESLFTEYDLRTNPDDPMTRLPVPPDSELHWGYGMIATTKATVLALATESYVYRLEIQTRAPSAFIYSRKNGTASRKNKPVELRVDALGRGLMRPNRSINSYVKPLPRR